MLAVLSSKLESPFVGFCARICCIESGVVQHAEMVASGVSIRRRSAEVKVRVIGLRKATLSSS